MGKFFLSFESYLSSPDTSPSFTPKEYEEDSRFRIANIKAQAQEGGVIVITIPFFEDKVIQIIRVESSGSYKVLGDLFKSRKDAWKFKQELASNSNMKVIMREYNLTDLFHYISVSDFHIIK